MTTSTLIMRVTDLTDRTEATVRFNPEHHSHPYSVTLRDLDAGRVVATQMEATRTGALNRAVFWCTPAETEAEREDRFRRYPDHPEAH